MIISRKSTRKVLRRTIPAAFTYVDAICDQTRDMLMDVGLAAEVFPVQLLLRESIANAILHGSGASPARQVVVEVRIGEKWIILHVEDNGPGFDWNRVRKIVPDVERTSGRGLPIYALYAKRTFFNKAGNHVTLVRKIKGDKHEPV